MNKRDIRKSVLAVRDGIPAGDRVGFDERIRARVLADSAYREAQVVLAYASYQSEVDTMALIGQALSDGKHVFAPKVSGSDMEFWKIASVCDLREGYRGIPEPPERISLPEWIAEQRRGQSTDNTGKKANPDAPGRPDSAQSFCKALMLMPGVVFDVERRRIGYGKGFYDRYLDGLSDSGNRNTGFSFGLQLATAALAYGCQVLGQIPCEPHDVRPDMIMTEREKIYSLF